MKRKGLCCVLLIFLTILVCAGCAGVSGGNFIGANIPDDAGPIPENYEETSRQYLLSILKDPGSLQQFSVSIPVKTSCAIGIYGPFWGWRVTVRYNAKNSFGGYVGLQTRYFWFHGEAITAVTDNPTFCPEIQVQRVHFRPKY